MTTPPQTKTMSKKQQKIEVQCDEDGETFVCFGTENKRKALTAIRSFMSVECGLDREELPHLDDLELSPLWYGLNEDEGDDWYWWGNPPETAKYIGSCFKYNL